MADDDQVVIEHPNRRKASSQLARLVVIVLLIASAAVVLIISIGGWDTIEGAKPVQVAFIPIYLVFALFVARWSRGVLPMIAALAMILGIFAAVAGPAWFDRDKDGFTDPALARTPRTALLPAARTPDRAGHRRDDRLPPGLECRGREAARPTGSGTGARGRINSRRRPARVEERQTRSSQKALPLRACGFESRPGHLSVVVREVRGGDLGGRDREHASLGRRSARRR